MEDQHKISKKTLPWSTLPCFLIHRYLKDNNCMVNLFDVKCIGHSDRPILLTDTNISVSVTLYWYRYIGIGIGIGIC